MWIAVAAAVALRGAQLANVATPEQLANVATPEQLAALDGVVARLTSMAADPADPVPAPTA